MTPFALRIVNDVSYLTGINHESHFAWQAQNLVMLVIAAPATKSDSPTSPNTTPATKNDSHG